MSSEDVKPKINGEDIIDLLFDFEETDQPIKFKSNAL